MPDVVGLRDTAVTLSLSVSNIPLTLGPVWVTWSTSYPVMAITDPLNLATSSGGRGTGRFLVQYTCRVIVQNWLLLLFRGENYNSIFTNIFKHYQNIFQNN